MPIYRHGTGFMHIRMTNTKKHPAPAPCCARIPHPSNEGGKPEVRCMGQIAPEKNLCPVHLALHRADHPELG